MQFEINDIFAHGDNQIKTLSYSHQGISSLNIDLLNDEDKVRFGKLGCEKRKAEFFFTRVLWQHFDAYQRISYNENGKPFLSNGHLSISHSKNIVAISYGKHKSVGVDVEHFNPKISLGAENLMYFEAIKDFVLKKGHFLNSIFPFLSLPVTHIDSLIFVLTNLPSSFMPNDKIA